ncbi:YfiR family protein [Xylophilus sp. GOD-11R]|uniref:YfiR family protein n=1 Tax=Xylophilus sp. GOD-11R TaxID=3089814 RepID=UPI00298CB04C|nr:YfiR family protein [Xylophilus sp. GOD-11R]WPB57272.1 YfiR family protein [Xylophilus sp. GOD-11R]
MQRRIAAISWSRPRPGRLAASCVVFWLAGSIWPAFCVAQPATTAPVDVSTAHAVARTTFGIVSFARWPGDPPQVRLCVIGVTRFAAVLLETRDPARSGGRRVSVRQRAPVDAASDCDALYIGELPDADLRQVSRRIAGRPELTIGERLERCGQGSVFCLDIQLARVDFRVDPEALARSGVRVHPALLQLGRRREARR